MMKLKELENEIDEEKEQEEMSEEEEIESIYNTALSQNKKNRLMMYDRGRKTDIPLMYMINDLSLSEYENNKYDFFMTINTGKNKSADKTKDEFNWIKNQYGYFLYGKQYPQFLDLKYVMIVELSDYDDLKATKKYEYFKKYHQCSIINNTHLHIIWRGLTIPDIYGLQAFLYHKYSKLYPNSSIYTKIMDTDDCIIYGLKKNDSELLNQDYFKKD